MGSLPKRLYIFTGKGGVGKTSLALAFTRYLKEQGYHAKYASLSQQSLSDEEISSNQLPKGWGSIPHIHLELEDCAKGYITKKMGSQMVAKWVVGTAYFRALVNMLPGFGYVISIGKILELLQEDPKLILVLDAPASGHALTMMEATSNFREIFQSGLVFEDTEKMLSKLYDRQHTGIRIMTLPTVLAMQEALELKLALQKLSNFDTTISLNHSLKKWQKTINDGPRALQQKLSLEIEVEALHPQDVKTSFAFSAAQNVDDFYQDLLPQLPELI